MKSKVVRYNSWLQGLELSQQAGRVTGWRRERRWEMVELKDRQQRETEGKMQFHSCPMGWNTRSHLCKFKAWRYACRGLTVNGQSSDSIWVATFIVTLLQWPPGSIWESSLSYITPFWFSFHTVHMYYVDVLFKCRFWCRRFEESLWFWISNKLSHNTDAAR